MSYNYRTPKILPGRTPQMKTSKLMPSEGQYDFRPRILYPSNQARSGNILLSQKPKYMADSHSESRLRHIPHPKLQNANLKKTGLPEAPNYYAASKVFGQKKTSVQNKEGVKPFSPNPNFLPQLGHSSGGSPKTRKSLLKYQKLRIDSSKHARSEVRQDASPTFELSPLQPRNEGNRHWTPIRYKNGKFEEAKTKGQEIKGGVSPLCDNWKIQATIANEIEKVKNRSRPQRSHHSTHMLPPRSNKFNNEKPKYKLKTQLDMPKSAPKSHTFPASSKSYPPRCDSSFRIKLIKCKREETCGKNPEMTPEPPVLIPKANKNLNAKMLQKKVILLHKTKADAQHTFPSMKEKEASSADNVYRFKIIKAKDAKAPKAPKGPIPSSKNVFSVNSNSTMEYNREHTPEFICKSGESSQRGKKFRT